MNKKEEFFQNKVYYESLDNLKTKYGTPYKIKEYNGYDNVIIEFLFSGITKSTNLKLALNGKVKDPFYRNNGKHLPFTFENPADNYNGRIFTNNDGEQIKIINYINYRQVLIQFMDPPFYQKYVSLNDLEHKRIKDPYHKNSFGGYIGEGTEYTGSKYTPLHSLWIAMLIRGNYQEHINKSYCPEEAYENCIVGEDWKNYTNFARDYMNMLSKLNPEFKYDMDKDLLYPFYKDKYNGLKVYSGETVVIIPHDVNIWLRNVEHNTFDIKFPCNYINQYTRYENWKDKFVWYKQNGGLTDLTFSLLMQVLNDALERLCNKFPEFENERLRRINEKGPSNC